MNLAIKGGGGDFYVNWVAGRSFMFDRIEPYSGGAAARTQALAYGSPAGAGDEPFFLDTPFHILLLYFPFSLLPQPELARAVFTLILEMALVGIPLLSLRLLEVRMPGWFSILMILFAVLNFYSIQAVFSASPVLLLGLAYIGILVSLRLEADEIAGALMAISLYYWEVGAPFLVLVMFRAYKQKRARVLAGFFMVSFILLAISFLLYPDWIIPFLRASVNNLRAEFGYNLLTVFDHLWPDRGRAYAWMIIIALAVLLGREWSIARGADFARFYWTAGLTLTVSPLLGFRTEMEHLAVLVVPVVIIVSTVLERWSGSGLGLAAAYISLMLALPWAVYLYGRFPKDWVTGELLFLFYPVVTLISLYWVRWWIFRAPRTWVDMKDRYK